MVLLDSEIYSVHSVKPKTYTRLASTPGAITSRGVQAANISHRRGSLALVALDMAAFNRLAQGRRAAGAPRDQTLLTTFVRRRRPPLRRRLLPGSVWDC